MHWLTLKVLEPPLQDDTEYNIIQKLLCPQNIIETELILLMFEKETTSFFEKRKGISKDLLISANKPQNGTNSFGVLQYLNKIIYRAPFDTNWLAEAILARSIHNIRQKNVNFSHSDLLYYKTLYPNGVTAQEKVLVQTLLCLTFYAKKDMNGARVNLQELSDLLTRLPKTMWDINPEMQKYFDQLDKIKKEVNQNTNTVTLKIKPKNNIEVPFNGFKLSKEIPWASNACDYVSASTEQRTGVYARVPIPKNEAVVSEDPAFFQYSVPFTNCELCGIHQALLYTCPGCRYKTYCSENCISADKEEHRNECYLYKIGIIPVLEATQLYRFFVQAAKLLFNTTFKKKGHLRKFINSQSAWNFIVKNAKTDENSIIVEFLVTKPNYNLLTPAKWWEIISTAFRLAVFMHKSSFANIFDFGEIGLGKLDCIHLIAAILLRLNGHITLNSIRTELRYNISQTLECETDSPEVVHNTNSKAGVERITTDAFEYYKIIPQFEFVQIYKEHEKLVMEGKLFPAERTFNINESKPIYRWQDSPLAEYTLKIMQLCLNSNEIKSANDIINVSNTSVESCKEVLYLNTSKRCELIAKFVNTFQTFLDEYFIKLAGLEGGYLRQERTALCSTLKKFNHSCAANVQVRALTNGQYIATTNQKINVGDELTLSHDVNIWQHNRSQRRSYFENLGTTCRCTACALPECLEPTNIRASLYCNCSNQRDKITPLMGECPKCHTKYAELLQEKTNFIDHIQDKIRERESGHETTVRQLVVLYGTYNFYVNDFFAEFHEARIRSALKLSKFLASQGFLQHASDTILMIDYEYSFLVDATLANSFFFEIFEVIKAILEGFIRDVPNLMEIDVSHLHMLMAMASKLLKDKHMHLDAYLNKDKRFNILQGYFTDYQKWLSAINLHFFMPNNMRALLSK